MVNTSYNSSNRFTALSGQQNNSSNSVNNRNRSASRKRSQSRHKFKKNNSNPPNVAKNNTQCEQHQCQTPDMSLGPDQYTIVLDSDDYDECNNHLVRLTRICNDIAKQMNDPNNGLSLGTTEILGNIINAIGCLGKFQDRLLNNIKRPEIRPVQKQPGPSPLINDEFMQSYAEKLISNETNTQESSNYGPTTAAAAAGSSWTNSESRHQQEIIMVDLANEAEVRRLATQMTKQGSIDPSKIKKQNANA